MRLNKIDGCVISFDGKIKYLIFIDYGLFNKIFDKVKYHISKKVVLQIVLIIILERSKDPESLRSRRWLRKLCLFFKIYKNESSSYLYNLIPGRLKFYST